MKFSGYSVRLVILAALGCSNPDASHGVEAADSASPPDTVPGEEAPEPPVSDVAADEGLDEWEPTPPPCGGLTADQCRVESVVVGEDERTYMVTGDLDGDCGKRPPLVLAWHGKGVNPEYLRLRLTLEEVGGEAALVVYPAGLPRPELGGQTGWNRDPEGNDVAFFDALPNHLATGYCVDPDRVFSVGSSRGGRFVEVLACFRGSAHLGLASISAGTGNVQSCPDQSPIWITHSREDIWVHFASGLTHVNAWSTRNHCDGVDPNDSEAFPNDACTSLPGCEAPVVWCPSTHTSGGGHEPPPFAQAEIEAFFGEQLTP